jgi:uncharacterized protein YjbI with pentapeptide repeats
MANEEHVGILEYRVDVWNEWREENPDTRPDLDGAELYGADLDGANLRGADLNGAHLSGAGLFEADLTGANLASADLFEADLSQAYLNGANLREADLLRADLTNANLSQADLSRANLIWANLNGADLSGANLSEAQVGLTVFANIDLSLVEGLDAINHRGPSTIGIDTILCSKGKISEAFLRGCGLSDIEIETAKLHNPDLTSEKVANITAKINELYAAKPVEYHSCFISYSSKDEAFARRLYADLQQKGVRCWFAPEDMKIGDRIRPAIDQAIRLRDKLLLILSERSINSTWVEKEVETAFEEERKRGQTVLLPVRLDETVMETAQAWAADIHRTRHIGDFSRWKDRDAYQKAFERLLRDLKAEG